MKNKKFYTKGQGFMLVLACLCFGGIQQAMASHTVSSSTAWSLLGFTPTSSDVIIIDNGATLTVDATNAIVGEIQIGDGGGVGILDFATSGSPALTVTTAGAQNGTITTGDGGTGTLNMETGATLTVAKLANGTNTANYSLNAGLVILDGTFTLPAGAHIFNNLTISAGGFVTCSQATTINGDLIIDNTSGNASFYADGTKADVLTVNGNVTAGLISGTADLYSFPSGGTSGSDITIVGNLAGTANLHLFGDASGVSEGELCTIGGDMTIAAFDKDQAAAANPSTVLFNGTGHSQLIKAGNDPTKGFAFDYLEIENSSGVNLGNNTTGHIEVDWDLEGNSPLNTSTTEFYLLGDMNIAANDFVVSTGEILHLDGASAATGPFGNNVNTGTNTIANPQTFYNVKSDNFNTILDADVVITHNLDFTNNVAVGALGAGGGILLNGHNLDMTNGYITWEEAGVQIPTDGYIITDQSTGGYLYMTTTTSGPRLFPVGDAGFYDATGGAGPITNSYTPITFTSANTAEVLHVLVKAGLTNSNLHAMADSAIAHEWVVQPQNGTADDFTTSTSWFSTADELPGMDYTAAYLSSRTQELTSPAYWIPFGRTTQGGAPFTGATYEGGTAPDSFLSSKPLSMSSAHTFYIATGSDNILANALPVTLVNFTAAPENGVVDLNWNTASEINNNYFEVERSVNGQNWTSLGQVKGNGTTMLMHDYAFVDNLAGVVPAGTFYYRLKQVDFNGVFAYSMVRSVNLSSVAPNIATYPNPTGNALNVNWTSTSNDVATLTLVNISGVTVYQTTAIGEGQMQKQLDLTGLAKGTYFLQISSDNGMTLNQTIVKN